ncbi:MAG TPA: FtsX-like permease family protein [Dehalococcoidia bacterium]|nr:FtsX-like permease family protein [Dehalococcoidia bacterium]
MDKLFGIQLNSIMVALLILLAVVFAVIVWIGIRRPLLVRMGLRNAIRRPAQTALIVVGLMLSTLIISAAFSTGDTVGYSITNLVYGSLQGVDYLVGFDREKNGVEREQAYLTTSFLDSVRQQFGNDPDVDGITPLLVEQLPILNESQRLSQPQGAFIGVDPGSVASFHALRDLDDNEVSADALTGNRTYISDRLSSQVNARAGDTLTVFVENKPTTFEVIGVVRDTSITSRQAFDGGSGSEPPGGMIVNLQTAQQILDRSGRVSYVGVSTAGGTRDALALRSDRVEQKLDDFIDANPDSRAKVIASKHDLVSLAEIIGSVFVTFFIVFGLFSIAAGIMLIFLIFIMLAAERRSEMGMARAVGMSRLNLTESFLAEGMAYNIGSAAVGAVLGLGVSALLVFILARTFNDSGFNITFHFNPRAFVIAYSLGVVLTFVTVTFSAYRAANLNIVRAIRDIDEPQMLRGPSRSISSLLLSAVGVLWYLAWLGLVIVLALGAAALFFLGLSTYGLGLLAAGALVGLFWFGARLVNVRSRRSVGQWVLLVLWAVAFNVIALLTWVLLKTRAWAGHYRNAGGWALWMLIGGVVLTYLGGWVWHQQFAYTGGTTLAVLAVAMLAVYFGTPSRPAFTIASIALVWYWLLPLPFSLFTDDPLEHFGPLEGLTKLLGLPQPESDGNIEMFFVSGICITASATLLVIFNADALLAIVSAFGRLLGGIAPALKTAIAYPLASKFRTGITLAMFGLVVFSLVVMATLNSNFTQLFAGDEAKAGFDVMVEGNPSNRIPDLRVALRDAGYQGPALAGVGTQLVASTFGAVVQRDAAPKQDILPISVVGDDDEFLRIAKLPMKYRAAGYETDEAIIQALRNDPTVAVVDDSLISGTNDFGGPASSDQFDLSGVIKAEGFDPVAVTVKNPRGGDDLHLKVIGTLEPQVTGILQQLAGLHVNRQNVDRLFGGGDAETFFVKLEGSPSKRQSVDAANAIESALLERGVQASSIQERIDDSSSQSTAFQYLFEGFMGLGLVVGIAALGVIAFRTVVERRQQIGMLRAIGYSRRLVALSFFFESSFIALAGVAMGLLLGGALSYNLLTSPTFTSGATIEFHFPWIRILVICAIAYGASALMTLIPARAASRVAVAEALRYE